jgi:GTP-binding protein Era
VNKIDLSSQKELEEKVEFWNKEFPQAEILPISALHNLNVDLVLKKITELLPESPPYFPKDQLTDKPMRFFVSEIIREKLLLHYKKEIPYAAEVVVESYKEEKDIVRTRAEIYVERDSQKGILIGKGGKALKQVGIDARKDIETFVGKQVFLDLYVKVDKNWRSNANKLKRFGYIQ